MQEVLQQNKEIEFINITHNKTRCPRCNRNLNTNCFIFNRVIKQSICNRCNKSVGTNPFYNTNWKKNKNFISKRSLTNEEKYVAITNLQRQGLSLSQAKDRIFGDINKMKQIKYNHIEENKPINQNLDIHKGRSELNKELVKGLGFKEKI